MVMMMMMMMMMIALSEGFGASTKGYQEDKRKGEELYLSVGSSTARPLIIIGDTLN